MDLTGKRVNACAKGLVMSAPHVRAVHPLTVAPGRVPGFHHGDTERREPATSIASGLVSLERMSVA